MDYLQKSPVTKEPTGELLPQLFENKIKSFEPGETKFNFSESKVTQLVKLKNKQENISSFGSVFKMEEYGNICVFEEIIPENTVKVFWNKESGEIFKLLGNNEYAHYITKSLQKHMLMN